MKMSELILARIVRHGGDEMLPSEWATVDIDFGEGKKHLYSTDSASLEFHPDYATAMKVARKNLEEGTKMVAVMNVNRLVRIKSIALEEIK